MNENIKNFIISLISSVVIFFTILFFIKEDTIKVIHTMNSFFATGLIFALIGLGSYVSNQGGFDALKYSMKYIIRFKNTDTYYDYKKQQESKDKKSFSIHLIVGFIYIIISIILMLFFNK